MIVIPENKKVLSTPTNAIGMSICSGGSGGGGNCGGGACACSNCNCNCNKCVSGSGVIDAYRTNN